jgi:hypothetical protein
MPLHTRLVGFATGEPSTTPVRTEAGRRAPVQYQQTREVRGV